MVTIQEMIRQAKLEGYTDENAEAKVCQDIVLKALSESSFTVFPTNPKPPYSTADQPGAAEEPPVLQTGEESPPLTAS